MYKSKVINLFYPGLDGSPYYRIPSLARLKNGDLIAAADQRLETESDWGGMIEPAIRIRTKGKDEFSSIIKPFKQAHTGSKNPTYTIDTCLIPADFENKDKIYMVLDKFKSNGNYLTAKKGTGYVEVCGEKCPILFYTSQNSLLFEKIDERYYIKDGSVYTMDHLKTSMTVVMEDRYPFDSLGDIYDKDKYIGNIYSDKSSYQVHQTSYLWFTYSEDGGRTWQSPKDISMDVADDRMMFLGVSPGRGIQTPEGRIIVPVYYTTDNDCDIYDLREHAALIYSDDFGKRWKRSKSVNDFNEYKSLDGYVKTNTSESQLVRLKDGTIILFSRTTSNNILYSYSTDNGESFSENLIETDFKSEAFCMVSVCKYERGNKEYILVANPKGPGRNNGFIRVMEVGKDKSLKTIKEKRINSTNFTYSCIELISDEGIFGLLYEQRQIAQGEEKEFIKYTEFDFDWLMDQDNKSTFKK
ncbi:exo-alpha-sialidase [uncultured Anaerococcus sp.]|uniref:sialidase family protein n=1 Tax=uncultured Anaerococcus sp. TaxID=293428 RepID=UPI0025F81DF3|nr:sialidase family protein [uncultured Anaerococcus sp.]